MRRRAAWMLGFVIVSAAARAASAQDAAPAAQAPVVGFQDGFFVQSANGDNRLVFGMLTQIDGRFSLDDPAPFVDTFTIRKARPTFTGRVAKYFDFKLMPDFGNGTAVVQDAYFDVRFSPAFRVRVGKDKVPVGYEYLIGDAYLLFPERSLASSLVPARDIGVQVQGDLARNRVSYAGGVVNGAPDNTTVATDIDANNGKDLVGRVVVQPFKREKDPGPLNGFGFQIGGSSGKETGALPSFKTSAQQTYFSYASTATSNGTRTRVTPAVFLYYKSFGGFAEYVRSTQAVAKGTTLTDVANRAWDVNASLLLTGEASTDRIVRPASPFDPQHGRWGAVQLLVRYSVLTVDPAAFDAGLAAANASQQAKQFSVGADWFPAAYVKYYLLYERTAFDNTAARPNEHVVVFRAQVAF